jgi:hypothetical protein
MKNSAENSIRRLVTHWEDLPLKWLAIFKKNKQTAAQIKIFHTNAENYSTACGLRNAV